MGIESDIEKIWAKEWPSVVVKGRNHVPAKGLFDTLRMALFDFYAQHGEVEGNLVMPTSTAEGSVELEEGKDTYEFPVYLRDESEARLRIEDVRDDDGFIVGQEIIDPGAVKRGVVRIKRLKPDHKDVSIKGCDFPHVPNRIRKQHFAVNFSMFGERRKELNFEDRDAFMSYIARYNPRSTPLI